MSRSIVFLLVADLVAHYLRRHARHDGLLYACSADERSLESETWREAPLHAITPGPETPCPRPLAPGGRRDFGASQHSCLALWAAVLVAELE